MSFSNAYNITIPDQSTSITYSPYRDGVDSAHGWKAMYSSSDESTYNPNSTENKAFGVSSHFTTLVGASFQIDFMGSAITLFGSGLSSYTTALDGGDPNAQDAQGGILARYTSLDFKPHVLVLNVTGSVGERERGLTFTKANITIGIGHPGETIVSSSSKPVETETGVPVQNNRFVKNGGGFSIENDWQEHPRLDTNSYGDSINFTTVKSSAILVYGSSNIDHSQYSVAASPPVGATSGTRTFNASSRWFSYDNIIYWESGLDASQAYTFTFTNLGSSGAYFDISEIISLEGQEGQSPNDEGGLDTGAIVGLAIGVAAILAVALFGFLFWKRRRGNKRRDSYQIDPSPLNYHTLGEGIHGYIEPFLLPHETSHSHNDSRPTTGESYGAGGSRSSKYSSLSTPPTAPGTFYPGFSPSVPGSSSHTPSPSNDYGRDNIKNPSGPSESRLPVRREDDAGPVRAQDREEVLPPGYNPAWSTPGLS